MNQLEDEIRRIVKQSVKEVLEEYLVGTLSDIKHEREHSPTSLHSTDPLRIIRASELAEILSISRTTLWRLEKEGHLPRKITIGSRSIGWLRKDIEDYLSSQKSEV